MGKAAIYVLIFTVLISFASPVFAQGSTLDLDQFDGLSSPDTSSDSSGQGWIISDFIDNLQFHTYTFVKNTYDDLSGITHNYFIFFTSVWLIYIIVSKFFLMGTTPPLNILMQFFLIIIASTLLTSGGSGVFFAYVYEPLVSNSVKLSSFFMNKATTSGGNFDGAIVKLENLFKNTLAIGNFIADSTPAWNVIAQIKAFLLFIVLVLVVAALIFLFAAYWSYSIFALHILFALTPIMIALYPFKALRQYPEKWFSGVINYLLLPVLLSISMGITIAMFDMQLSPLLQDAPPDYVLGGAEVSGTEGGQLTYLILISVLSFLVHLRIGDIAAHLTGGVSTGLGATWAVGINTLTNVANLGVNAVKGSGDIKRQAMRGIKLDQARDKLLGGGKNE